MFHGTDDFNKTGKSFLGVMAVLWLFCSFLNGSKLGAAFTASGIPLSSAPSVVEVAKTMMVAADYAADLVVAVSRAVHCSALDHNAIKRFISMNLAAYLALAIHVRLQDAPPKDGGDILKRSKRWLRELSFVKSSSRSDGARNTVYMGIQVVAPMARIFANSVSPKASSTKRRLFTAVEPNTPVITSTIQPNTAGGQSHHVLSTRGAHIIVVPTPGLGELNMDLVNYGVDTTKFWISFSYVLCQCVSVIVFSWLFLSSLGNC